MIAQKVIDQRELFLHILCQAFISAAACPNLTKWIPKQRPNVTMGWVIFILSVNKPSPLDAPNNVMSITSDFCN